MPVRVLIFNIGAFREGEQVTVRLGPKWFNLLTPGEQVEARSKRDNRRLGVIDIVNVQMMKICDIPEELLAQEQDPLRQSHQRLMNSLNFDTGKKVSPRQVVSVVHFVPPRKGRVISDGAA